MGPKLCALTPPKTRYKRIKPDDRGLRHVPYTVLLVKRDTHGHVTDQETFNAVDLIPAY